MNPSGYISSTSTNASTSSHASPRVLCGGRVVGQEGRRIVLGSVTSNVISDATSGGLPDSFMTGLDHAAAMNDNLPYVNGSLVSDDVLASQIPQSNVNGGYDNSLAAQRQFSVFSYPPSPKLPPHHHQQQQQQHEMSQPPPQSWVTSPADAQPQNCQLPSTVIGDAPGNDLMTFLATLQNGSASNGYGGGNSDGNYFGLYAAEPQFSLSENTVEGQSVSTLEQETFYLNIPASSLDDNQTQSQQPAPNHTAQPQSQLQRTTVATSAEKLEHSPTNAVVFRTEDHSVLVDGSQFQPDLSSNRSSSNHRTTPSPKLTIPPNLNYAGPHDFRLRLVSAPSVKEKKTPPWTYSNSLNRLFCKIEEAVPVGFSCDLAPPPGSRILCMLIFSSPSHIQETVTRCPHHVREDESELKANLVRAEHSDAQYGLDARFSRESVNVPYDKPQAGSDISDYIFKFMCNNSCQGGINRRETQAIFTLFSPFGDELGRAVVDLRICASPGRDRKKEEEKRDKAKMKLEIIESESGSPAGAAPTGGSAGVCVKRKLETATVTTEVTTLTIEPRESPTPRQCPSDEVSENSIAKRLRLEADADEDLIGDGAGEVFTITTRYKQDYEILLKMKEGLEFARMATAEKRDAVKRKVLSEVSHDPYEPARNGAPPTFALVADGHKTNNVNDAHSSNFAPSTITKSAAKMGSSTPPSRRSSSHRVVPDPDSTTATCAPSMDAVRQDRNLNETAQDDEMDLGTDEKPNTQPFTSIKSASIGSSETDILHGLTDIFDADDNLIVFSDGANRSEKSKSKSSKRHDDNNNNAGDEGAIAEWLKTFGMVAYTDDFARLGFVKIGDLKTFDQSKLEKMKLSKAHSAIIWKEVNQLRRKQSGSSASSSTAAMSKEEEEMVPSLEKMKLRGMSRFKKEMEEKMTNDDDNDELDQAAIGDDSARSEANRKTVAHLNSQLPLFTDPKDNNNTSKENNNNNEIAHFFSQPSELPSCKIEPTGPISSSQPVDDRFPSAEQLRLHRNASFGVPSRSLGSLSQFLRDQVGSFGLNSTLGLQNSSSGNIPDGGKYRNGGVLKVQKYTFRHSFSLNKE